MFIIGNKDKELPLTSSETSILTKRDTLERFARNNRNVVIITYDELYKKAFYMLHHLEAPEINYVTQIATNNSIDLL